MPRDYMFKVFKIANEVFPPDVVCCINDYVQEMESQHTIDTLKFGFLFVVYSAIHALWQNIKAKI